MQEFRLKIVPEQPIVAEIDAAVGFPVKAAVAATAAETESDFVSGFSKKSANRNDALSQMKSRKLGIGHGCLFLRATCLFSISQCFFYRHGLIFSSACAYSSLSTCLQAYLLTGLLAYLLTGLLAYRLTCLFSKRIRLMLTF